MADGDYYSELRARAEELGLLETERQQILRERAAIETRLSQVNERIGDQQRGLGGCLGTNRRRLVFVLKDGRVLTMELLDPPTKATPGWSRDVANVRFTWDDPVGTG